MSAITIRNLPEAVHDGLRRLPAKRNKPVEALARDALGHEAGPGGIDFAKLACERAAFGLVDDGPDCTAALDDPALSRRVLGLDRD